MVGKTLYASGRSAFWREPDQTELSFSTIRSSSTPPNIIAPNRPLPIGEDSVNSFAGASNQIVVSGVMESVSACAGAIVSTATAHSEIEIAILVVIASPKSFLQSQDESTARWNPVCPCIL